jgi:trehalose-6-phosphate synthase
LDALIVNPYDPEGVAEAIHQALEMDRPERRMRMQRMRNHVMDHNIYRWAASILGDLRDLRMEIPKATDSKHPSPASVAPVEVALRQLA